MKVSADCERRIITVGVRKNLQAKVQLFSYLTMARQQNTLKSSSHSKTHPSRKTNAVGYAKRQTLKSKTLGGDFGATDVYEYQPEKVRRSKVKLLLEKDDIAATQAEGHSDDGEREEGRTGAGRRPRMLGEDEDDNEIKEDEDEEIDSDAAFEESDEERFAGFSFSYKVCYADAQHKLA